MAKSRHPNTTHTKANPQLFCCLDRFVFNCETPSAKLLIPCEAELGVIVGNFDITPKNKVRDHSMSSFGQFWE